MAYDNTNTGALFKNDKGDNQNRPDYKGSVNINGQEFWLSAWIKTSKQDTKFMSLKAEPKDKAEPAPARSAPPARTAPPKGAQGSGFDDFEDVPF